MSLLIVGSLALDHVETPATTSKGQLGGSGWYCAFAASYFTPAHLVSVVGNDWPAGSMIQLNERRVDTSLVKVDGSQPSFHWRGRYEEDMNNRETIELDLNAYAGFEPTLPEALKTPFVFLANLIPGIQLRVLDQLSGDEFVVIDTHADWFDEHRADLEEVMRRVDGVTLSESEAALLTGESDVAEAGRRIIERGPRFAIIKMGTSGSMFVSEGGCFSLPAFIPEVAVDPTGAGDTFAGGLMGWLASQPGIVDGLASGNRPTREEMRTAMEHGTVLASFTVEAFSTGRLESVTDSDLETRLTTYRAKDGSAESNGANGPNGMTAHNAL